MTSATVAVELTRQHRRGRLYVALAAVAWSTAGLLQRELTVNIGTQLAGRAFFAVLGLFAFVAVAERGQVVRSFRAIGKAGLAVAALMAASSGAFIVALNYTSVANVLFFQAISPILAAVLGTFVGESVRRRTWIAMAVALAGVGLMVGGPSHPGAAGIALSLFMSISFAAVIVITRHQREVSMAPATCLSQALVFVFAAPFASVSEVDGRDLALLIGLGVGQIGLGLIFLTIGARLIPAAEVALITLLEIVLGPLWVWIALGERPGTSTLIGGAIVLAAVVIEAIGEPEEPAVPPP
ncbi:MAG TPA: DMT family transporter [Gaiellaceae bacterium]|nr:DMT family transporter [Gaiellaceae bacterium]